MSKTTYRVIVPLLVSLALLMRHGGAGVSVGIGSGIIGSIIITDMRMVDWIGLLRPWYTLGTILHYGPCTTRVCPGRGGAAGRRCREECSCQRA